MVFSGAMKGPPYVFLWGNERWCKIYKLLIMKWLALYIT